MSRTVCNRKHFYCGVTVVETCITFKTSFTRYENRSSNWYRSNKIHYSWHRETVLIWPNVSSEFDKIRYVIIFAVELLELWRLRLTTLTKDATGNLTQWCDIREMSVKKGRASSQKTRVPGTGMFSATISGRKRQQWRQESWEDATNIQMWNELFQVGPVFLEMSHFYRDLRSLSTRIRLMKQSYTPKNVSQTIQELFRPWPWLTMVQFQGFDLYHGLQDLTF